MELSDLLQGEHLLSSILDEYLAQRQKFEKQKEAGLIDSSTLFDKSIYLTNIGSLFKKIPEHRRKNAIPKNNAVMKTRKSTVNMIIDKDSKKWNYEMDTLLIRQIMDKTLETLDFADLEELTARSETRIRQRILELVKMERICVSKFGVFMPGSKLFTKIANW
jgi:hypothetical protein